VVIVEGAGHFLQVEKPDEINELVVDFVTAS
jgi:pimeloyl-ACP methyl ester carboxylesterase